MTAIVAVVDKKGTVWMGGDSAGVNDKWFLHVRKDEKVFVNNDFIFGFTSSFRMGQILRYSFVPPPKGNQTDLEYMNTVFIDEARKVFEDKGYLKVRNNVEEGGMFLVGHNGIIYEIAEDFQVGLLHVNFNAVGCGRELALGSLCSTPNMEAKNRIKLALSAAESFSAGVRGPFVIKSLRKNK